MGDNTAKPDMKTTAGRIQDLRNRLDEARTPAAPRTHAR